MERMKVEDNDGINEIYLKVTIQDLEEENKTLKENIAWYEKEEDRLREENNRLKNNAMQDMKEITELEQENKNLKSELSECECSMHFENDEVGFWKGEYKRLKKWIKDHCKGYGDLFPEDEMKRQWKKADKKRKDILMEEDTLQELRDIGEI